jgi:histidinol-phosphate aminotransferase
VAEATGAIVHGGIDYTEFERLGIDPADVIDFSVNSNPYGPSPVVREALRLADIAHYPDRHCLALRRAIRAHELPDPDCALEMILCGNGTAELIWAVARALLAPGERAAVIGPTFGEYLAACTAVGGRVTEHRASHSEAGFVPDTAGITDWLGHERPGLVWLCNPNNPTGHWLDETDLSEIARACQRIGARLVIDEAYWRFLFPQEPFSAVRLIASPGMPEIIVLRSLTKDFALAGLRLGYLVATPEMTRRISAQLPSWNVSAAAQAAGVAALLDRAHLTRTLAMLAAEREAFFGALAASGFAAVPSRTHYCLLDVGDARSTRRQLLARGLVVRDCTSFGLPHAIRVATRPEGDWRRLIDALKETAQP